MVEDELKGYSKDIKFSDELEGEKEKNDPYLEMPREEWRMAYLKGWEEYLLKDIKNKGSFYSLYETIINGDIKNES